MTPIVLVLLDGLGDQPHDAFDGLTTNEAAETPNLDAFAASAATGLISPLGRGRAPSSELAHWSYFTGSLTSFPGRALLEALGHGCPLPHDAVVGYVALRAGTVDTDGVVRLGPRPRRGDEADAHALLADLPEGPFSGLRFRVHPLPGGDAVLALDGDADDAVSDTDSFEEDLHPLLACEAIGASAAARDTASAITNWTLAAFDVLRDHAVNVRRREAGTPAFEWATTKWWSRQRDVVAFGDRTGLRGAVVSEAAYQGGMAELLDLRWVRPPRAAPGRDSLEARLTLTQELLAAGFDFVHCHDKTADEAGHTKDPHAKRRAIESLDTALALLPAAGDDVVVVVTGDHATPSGGRMLHSGDPVPFLLRGARVAADDVTRFGERYQAAGALGHLHGRDLLPVALNAADRARFLGARPGAIGSTAIGAGPAPPLRLP